MLLNTAVLPRNLLDPLNVQKLSWYGSRFSFCMFCEAHIRKKSNILNSLIHMILKFLSYDHRMWNHLKLPFYVELLSLLYFMHNSPKVLSENDCLIELSK